MTIKIMDLLNHGANVPVKKSKGGFISVNDVYRSQVAKAVGEGSKGGHVIGHTRSGKAIYSHANHPKHEKFSGNDHRDAARQHGILASNYAHKQGSENNKMKWHHIEQEKAHKDAAYGHR